MGKLEIAIREGAMIDKSTRNSSRRLNWSDFKAKEARKAFAIGVLLMVLRELSGCGPMLQYTATLFKEAGSKLPAHVPAMLVNGIQIIGSVISMNLVDRAGRKVNEMLLKFSTNCSRPNIFLFNSVFIRSVDIRGKPGADNAGSVHDVQIMAL